MGLNLKPVDYSIILVGALIAVVAGFIGQSMNVTANIEVYTRFIVGGAITVTLTLIWMARNAWDGELARYLEIIGAGLFILMMSWIPHIGWHMAGSPERFGLNPSFWVSFFHILTAVTFLIIGYGFYQFWKEG